MKTSCIAVLLFALILAVSPVLATDVYYQNLSVESAGGQFKLTAVSPDNAESDDAGFGRPFADDFVYTLTNSSSGKELWKRVQPEREGSPREAFVSERGTCVIWTGWVQLVVLDAETGEVAHKHRILDQVRDADQEMHVNWTTAGPMWASFSHWYFLNVGQSEFFVLRPGWGHRQIVDIDQRTLIVDDVPQAVIEACLRHEREFTMSTLGNAVTQAKADPLSIDQHETITATVIAAQNGIREALPLIRDLEQLEREQVWDRDVVVEDYEPSRHRELLVGFHAAGSFELRLACQFALRILGERPAALPSSMLWYRTPDWTMHVVKLAQPDDRSQRATTVTELGNTAEALELLGPPDSLNYAFGRRWKYHYWDGDAHVTLSLSFDHRKEEIEVERIEPAIWRHRSLWIERLKP